MNGLNACLLLALTLPAAAAAQTRSATARPNIIYIMSDDHAAHAIGAYGSRVNRSEEQRLNSSHG